jgi:hypothetical protein
VAKNRKNGKMITPKSKNLLFHASFMADPGPPPPTLRTLQKESEPEPQLTRKKTGSVNTGA